MSTLSDIINGLNSIKKDSSIKLYFTQKNKIGYTTYSPNVEPILIPQLIELIKDNLNKKINAEETIFNPSCYKDGMIEYCTQEYVGNFNEVLKSFETADQVETELDPNNITFYCMDIISNDSKFTCKFFRRVTRFKRLSSKGILAWFSGGMLNKMEQPMLGLDGYIDLIWFSNKIYILNHIALERIFRLTEKFDSQARQALKMIEKIGKIANFEQFEEDCLSDKRYHKTLSKMMEGTDNFGEAFTNFDHIRHVIDMFDLDIEIIEGEIPQIRYEDKHQRLDILRIINDAYYQSIICERNGIDDN